MVEGYQIFQRRRNSKKLSVVVSLTLIAQLVLRLPYTNVLLLSYSRHGRRVSLITLVADCQTNQGSSADGPFASYAGVDGTSIYAAATSGTSALAVHLLACMLARKWSSSEATAIWVELVTERKKDIMDNSDPSQINCIAARAAAQQEISRAELAKWDASARAWLLSADEVRIHENIQLRLITKDCGMFVSSLGGTYASVIDVWTVAMSSLQRLILGMPQRISKGALLVGLSSWHIYPDLNVVGPTTHVKFNDPLVGAGGVITLGLQAASPESDDGVKWSLSLSHLRYYGEPVNVATSAGAKSQRISIAELHLVALGSVLGSWGLLATDAAAGAEVFIALRECLRDETDKTIEDRLPWLYYLWTAARSFLDAPSAVERNDALSLIAYGRQKGKAFLTESESDTMPIFDLADPLLRAKFSTEFSFDSDFDEENAIRSLRSLADNGGLTNENAVIRYRQKTCRHREHDGDTIWEYATAVSPPGGMRNPLGEGPSQDIMGHTR